MSNAHTGTRRITEKDGLDTASLAAWMKAHVARVHICMEGLTLDGSSSVPAFNTAAPGLLLDSLMTDEPHFGQKDRLSVFPLSALSS